MTLTELFTSIANAIRNKTGGTAAIKAEDFPAAISGIVIPILQSKTVSPSTSEQTVKPDTGYNGLSQVVVEGDYDLTAGNIKSGVTIFGVTGTYEGSGGGGSLAPYRDIAFTVEKKISDTYAGETTYTGEEFILLDIYPKTNGTVKVTYGGLTKTITDTSGADKPNAQQVFFGTFNGVSDSVETPANGTVTIEGDYNSFGMGTYSKSSKNTSVTCNCIREIISLGKISILYTLSLVATGITNTEIVIPVTVRDIESFSISTDALQTVIIEGNPNINGTAFSTVDIKTVKMLLTIPPELIPLENSDGTIVYDFFGDEDAEDYALEQIIVPKGCGNIYKTTGYWSRYADYIVEDN